MQIRWLLLLVPVYLLFAHLDHVAFWDDEAQTALLARNLNETGHLTGWNGRNLFAYRNGTLLADDFSVRQPPLDIIVTAFSFRFWNESVTSGRVPFALAGLLSLLLLFLSARVERKEWDFAFWSVATYGLSVAFILNVRQCRYYGLCLLFGVAARLLLLIWRERGDRWPLFLFPFAIALLYSANYLIAVAWMVALVPLILRRGDRGGLCAWVVALAIMAIHAVNYQIWARVDIPYDDTWIHRRLHHLWIYPRDLVYFLPLPLLIWGALLFRRERDPVWRRNLLCLFLNAVTLSIFTPQPGDSTFSDVRFSVLSIPLATTCLGRFFEGLASRQVVYGWAIFFLATLSNIFLVGYTRRPFELTLPALAQSIQTHYTTSLEEAVAFLRREAKPGDTVLAVPEHFNYPITYALPELVNCCTLDKNTPLRTALNLKVPLGKEDNAPDWLILFEKAPHTLAELERFEARGVRYEEVGKLRVFWELTQRPEPMWHLYFPKTDFDPAREGVYIYRRRVNPF
ncbi:MAG: hypothetical protein HYR96_08785 [Deltaproteobacteria bacterium]|nr:hypothetical protein [Deltaproteobacteria bacterium]MBI3294931.1 hypothetical protein [Deltaproteobacteria bacterium]